MGYSPFGHNGACQMLDSSEVVYLSDRFFI